MKLSKKDASIIIEALIIQTTHIQAQAQKCTSVDAKLAMYESYSNFLSLSIAFSKHCLNNEVIEISSGSKILIKVALEFLVSIKEEKAAKKILESF